MSASLACSCPGAAVLHARPYVSLMNEFCSCTCPRCPRPWRESNNFRRRVSGTYGRGLPLFVSQCRTTSELGIWIFSNRGAVVPCRRAVSSASVACASAITSGEIDVQIVSTRDRIGDHIVLPGDVAHVRRDL